MNLALLSAGVLGFRHGFDHDHIAAISDITSVQDTKPAMKLAMLYATGHALTVACLGSIVILCGVSLPHGVDRIAEILVGITLIVLAGYVLSCIIFKRHNEAPRSRISMLTSAARWLWWRVQSCSDPPLERPRSSDRSYDSKSVFVLGIIHGLGAETPTQLMVFLLAADLGGIGKGFLGLGIFIGGLLLMNTLMSAGATAVFRFRDIGHQMERALMVFTATYSFVVGVIFLLGTSSVLPALVGS
jgi:hypothetical protein